MTALHPLAWTASIPDAHAAIDRASALRDAGAPGLPEDPQVAAWLLAMFPDEAAARIAHALAHGAPHAAVAALAVASHFPPYHPACPPSPQAWRALREARVSVDAVEPASQPPRAASADRVWSAAWKPANGTGRTSRRAAGSTSGPSP